MSGFADNWTDWSRMRQRLRPRPALRSLAAVARNAADARKALMERRVVSLFLVSFLVEAARQPDVRDLADEIRAALCAAQRGGLHGDVA